MTDGESLKKIETEMTVLLNMYNVKEVAIEDGFVQHNESTKQIQRALGVVLCVLYEHEPYKYAPSTVKKSITGNGKANKTDIKNALLKIYPNLKTKNSDERDSIAIGLHHLKVKYGMSW